LQPLIKLLGNSYLVRAVALSGIQCGRYVRSFFGRNALFCARRYNGIIGDICGGNIRVKRVVNIYVNTLTEDSQTQTAACFVCELILLGECAGIVKVYFLLRGTGKLLRSLAHVISFALLHITVRLK
jgi:hypothetical protein